MFGLRRAPVTPPTPPGGRHPGRDGRGRDGGTG
jgi:hypothetical protein